MPDSLTRVFLCYRHEDTPWFAHLLKERLQAHFDDVFMDLNIKPGDDFTEVITTALNQCKVLLALIGTKWVNVLDEQGQRRLDDPGDWVVQEIEEALNLGVRVIPVLVDGAIMPKEAVLPAVLAPLANRHAVTIGHESFDVVAQTLINAIENELTKGGTGLSQPDGPDAAELQAKALRQAEMAQQYQRAVTAIQHQHWSEAKALLGPLADAGYRDATALSAEMSRRVGLENHYDQARAAMKAGDWSTAVDLLGPLRDIGFRDTAALLAQAVEQKDTAGRYERGSAAIADKKWAVALHELRPLNERRYRDSPRLFAYAGQRRQARTRAVSIVGAAAVFIAVLALGGVWFLSSRSDTSESPLPPPPTTDETSSVPTPSLDPESAPLDNDLIAVPRVVGGNLPQLYNVNASTGTIGDQYAIGPSAAYEPIISPDRRSIVYQERTGDVRTLHVIATDGTRDRELFNPRLPACNWMLRPAWNRADPNELAVTCVEGPTFTLMIVRLDDESSRTLVTGEWIDDMTFSPDGKTVVYFAANDVPAGIYSIPADGSADPVRLADGRRPMWSPDGRTIAFTYTDDPTDANADQDIYLMNPDGSNPRQLTSGPDRDACPIWSPDGRTLVFLSDRETNREGNRAWLIRADGAGLRRLSPDDDAYVDSPPAWTSR